MAQRLSPAGRVTCIESNFSLTLPAGNARNDLGARRVLAVAIFLKVAVLWHSPTWSESLEFGAASPEVVTPQAAVPFV
jgi:hypothetical protein